MMSAPVLGMCPSGNGLHPSRREPLPDSGKPRVAPDRSPVRRRAFHTLAWTAREQALSPAPRHHVVFPPHHPRSPLACKQIAPVTCLICTVFTPHIC
jgi:hypothetical protein